MRAGDRDAAVRCYQARGALPGDDGALARELATIVGGLSLVPPGSLTQRTPPPIAGNPIGELFASGRAELIAATTLGGGAVVLLTTGALASAIPAFSGGPLLLLAPVVGGALGFGTGVATSALWSGMTAGDALAIRSGLMLGGFNAITTSILVAGTPISSSITVPLIAAGVLTTSGIAGAALAAVTDLPEGASALAVSGGLWTSVLGVLGTRMLDTWKLSPNPVLDIAQLLLVTTNLGFAGGMTLGAFVPVTRVETWALDVGGAAGFLTGLAVAVNARAPNPFLGWGSMALGTVAGMGAGFAAARFLPGALGESATAPTALRVAPVLLPGPPSAPMALAPTLAVAASW